MSDIEIVLPSRLMKGCMVESTSNASISELTDVFVQCWNSVFFVKEKLDTGGTASILVEIWSDTGRIYWIVSNRRELFRFELKSSAIEKAYFEMLESAQFEANYAKFGVEVRSMIRTSMVVPQDMNISTIVVRDSDNSDSEEILKDNS